ncbi:MAG: S1 family peptidase [Myxococcota bacterium]
MFRCPALGLVLALTACEAASPPVAASEAPIINGGICQGEASTAMALLVDTTLTVPFLGSLPVRSVACTGTLIAPDVVLTAAHCVDETVLGQGIAEATGTRFFVTFEEDLVALSAGETMDFPPAAIEAAAWVKHEQFDINSWNEVNGPGRYYDIGLLFLERPVEGLEPERVITSTEASSITTGSTVTIAGWGASTEDVGSILMPPPRGTVGLKNCGAALIGEVAEWEFQVGTDQASTRKCRGDSGGPTYLNVAPGTAFPRRVVGVTSHAYDESLCDEGGLDTRVDAYLDWLDTRMRDACADGTRVWCTLPGLIPVDSGPVAVLPGSFTPDAGVPDRGFAAPDLGTPDLGESDLGIETDAGTIPPVVADAGRADSGPGRDLAPADGCACASPGQSSQAVGVLVLGLAVLRRRRRRPQG